MLTSKPPSGREEQLEEDFAFCTLELSCDAAMVGACVAVYRKKVLAVGRNQADAFYRGRSAQGAPEQDTDIVVMTIPKPPLVPKKQ